MKKTITHFLSLSICSALLLSSCQKKEDPITPEPTPVAASGKVKMEFSNKVGASNLALNSQAYINQSGDSFTVSKFDYYISNIKFNRENGEQYTEPESYHLLKQSDAATLAFDVSSIPNGTYKSVTFMIGVDSTRNVSGAQTGALDQGNNMFWSWITGYIMLKMEGTSPSSTEPGNFLQFHLGGFSGANSVLRTVTLTFPQDLVINGNTKHLHVSANLLSMFGNPNPIDFATLSAIHMPGANAKKIADNYAQMFTVTAVGD